VFQLQAAPPVPALSRQAVRIHQVNAVPEEDRNPRAAVRRLGTAPFAQQPPLLVQSIAGEFGGAGKVQSFGLRRSGFSPVFKCLELQDVRGTR